MKFWYCFMTVLATLALTSVYACFSDCVLQPCWRVRGLPKANSDQLASSANKPCIYVLRWVLATLGLSAELVSQLNEWSLGKPRAFQPSWNSFEIYKE